MERIADEQDTIPNRPITSTIRAFYGQMKLQSHVMLGDCNFWRVWARCRVLLGTFAYLLFRKRPCSISASPRECSPITPHASFIHAAPLLHLLDGRELLAG
jgi:hypothetical protein